MKITKLEHSGLVIENNQQKIVCDPVEFTHQLPKLDQVIAIVVTHKHNDHFHPEKITQILADNPQARLFAPEDIELDEIAGHPIEKVAADVVWKLPEFHLSFFGRDHASIIPGVVPCRNLGVIINGEIVNPGDSFDTPDLPGRVKVLCVPSAAPWCKVPEGMAYIKQVKPEIAIPVHDAVLSELGRSFNNNLLTKAAEEADAKLIALQPGESFELN